MRRLPTPDDDAADVYRLCIDRMRPSELKDRLHLVVDEVARCATEYDIAAAEARTFTLSKSHGIAGTVSAAEMEKLYTRRFAAKGSPGRALYDRLMDAPEHGACPYCGQRTVSTLDHYLPKAHYSPLAVAPRNLVPLCFECNKTKTDSSPTCAEDQHPHPYFEDFDDAGWLSASVVHGCPPAVRFECTAPSDWTEIQVGRMRHHFKSLGLGRLYSAHAASELVNLRGALRRINTRLGQSGVREHLDEIAVGCLESRPNSWQSATYVALRDDDWFCQGGFDF